MHRTTIIFATWLAASAASAITPDEDHARADSALQAFLIHFWNQSLGYLGESWPGNGSPTGYWTFAQGFDALLDGVERTGGRRYAGLIETFFEAQEARGWFNDFYDDEAWMALALIRAYDLTGEKRYLDRADSLYTDIEGAWDVTCCGAAPGGNWWRKSHVQKATASNAGPAMAGARLFLRNGSAAHLASARRVFDWWWDHMVNGATGQVYDHIEIDGSKVAWSFTYNQGVVIGAAIALYQATGDSRYLDKAMKAARFLVTSQVIGTTKGKALFDGSNATCTGDCAMFKGPGYRYLAALQAIHPDAGFAAVLEGSARAAWDLARDPVSGLFAPNWAGPHGQVFEEESAAAAAMALNLFAASRGPAPRGTIGRYEAEEAAIRGVGLEGSFAGYTGWGYVAGWNGEGTRVDFTVSIPVRVPCEIRLRYAAGAGDASRKIGIDDRAAFEDLVFPSSGSWSNYSTVSFQETIAAGVHRLSVAFDSSRGSRNFLNLDHLEVIPLVPVFIRGDANGDGAVDLADAVRLVAFLFLGSPVPTCRKAADADDDGGLDISDAVFLLERLFTGATPPIPAPWPDCGVDPTPDGLGCEVHLCEDSAP